MDLKKKIIYRGGYITASINKSKAISKPIRGGLKTASIGFSIEAVFKNHLYRTFMSIEAV